MSKKAYWVPQIEVFPAEHLMQGNGPVQNSGDGYKYGDEPVDGDELESKWFDFADFEVWDRSDESWTD